MILPTDRAWHSAKNARPDLSSGVLLMQQETARASAALVQSATFIQSTRDSGYLSTAIAVAELIDNALQASAQNVDVIVRKAEDSEEGLTLSVIDDGRGMSQNELTV